MTPTDENDRNPAKLESRGQPLEILKRIRPAFKKHVRPHTPDGQGERLGGGHILDTLWGHRGTRDVDAYVQLATTESGAEILDQAALACGAYRLDHPTFKRLEFERNKDNHVDVTFTTPTPRGDERTVTLDGEPQKILSTAQIMTGRLRRRTPTGILRRRLHLAAARAHNALARLRLAVCGPGTGRSGPPRRQRSYIAASISAGIGHDLRQATPK